MMDRCGKATQWILPLYVLLHSYIKQYNEGKLFDLKQINISSIYDWSPVWGSGGSKGSMSLTPVKKGGRMKFMFLIPPPLLSRWTRYLYLIGSHCILRVSKRNLVYEYINHSHLTLKMRTNYIPFSYDISRYDCMNHQ